MLCCVFVQPFLSRPRSLNGTADKGNDAQRVYLIIRPSRAKCEKNGRVFWCWCRRYEKVTLECVWYFFKQAL